MDDNLRYYMDAKDEKQRKEWLFNPDDKVPENMLPALKSKYLCYA